MSQSYASSIVGNGAQLFQSDDYLPWFHDSSKTILACVKTSPFFEGKRISLGNKIVRTFNTWVRYMSERVSNSAGFSRKLNIIERCDGAEHLTFYFGVSPGLLLNKGIKNPIAFSEKTQNARNKMARGYVWLTDPMVVELPFSEKFLVDWTEMPSMIDIFLLHEWGHVFGLEHEAGTILDARLSYFAFWPEFSNYHMGLEQWAQKIYSIDQSMELISQNSQNQTTVVRYPGNSRLTREQQRRLGFGAESVAPDLNIEAQLDLATKSAKLTFNLGATWASMPIELDPAEGINREDGLAFLLPHSLRLACCTAVQTGRMRIDNEVIPVTIQRNFYNNYSPVRMTAIVDGRQIDLFKANSKGWGETRDR
jgi:hypothetical protein